jgi:hypothetical protein
MEHGNPDLWWTLPEHAKADVMAHFIAIGADQREAAIKRKEDKANSSLLGAGSDLFFPDLDS